MTCIVAIEQNGVVVMGGDRFGSNGYAGEPVPFSKVFTKDRLLIGYCGSFRMGQILQHALEVPLKTLTDDVDRWIAIDLVQAMRKAFKDNEWQLEDSGPAKSDPILVAIDGRCYEIQSDLSYLRTITGEYAIGSGCYFAQGSMRSTRGKSAKARVVEALETAAEYVISVGGPYDLLVSKKK